MTFKKVSAIVIAVKKNKKECRGNNCLWSTTKKELSKLLNIDLIRILSDKNQQKRVSWKQLFSRQVKGELFMKKVKKHLFLLTVALLLIGC